VPWRVKVGAARPVEEATKNAAENVIEDARSRYRAGARSFRVKRLYDPDGGVRIINFERRQSREGCALVTQRG
jgi:hypothetical protein